MRIDHAGSRFLAGQSEKNQEASQKAQEKLATGKKLNTAADDAAAMAMAKQLEKLVLAHRRSGDNQEDAMSALRIAEGGSAQITQILQRQRELAIQASNGTLNQAQKTALNDEYQALTQEVDRVANATQFNGQALLNGGSPLSNGTGSLQIGPNSGSADQLGLTSTDLTSQSLSTAGSDLLNPGGAGVTLRALDVALETVSAKRSEQGSLYNRLVASRENSRQQEIQTAGSQSRLEDLDMAQGVTDNLRTSLLKEATNNMLGQMHMLSRNNVISLLE